ncbi:hypothetical protein ACFL0O_00700 [Thermodesulfobacteriota bacterium]
MRACSITLLLAAIFMIPVSVYCDTEQHVIETTDKGSINWTLGIVQGKGTSAPQNKAHDKSDTNPKTLRNAKRDASKNILDTILRVQVDATTTVKDIALENDVIMAEIEGMVREAQEVKNEYLSDGTAVLTLQMSLRGGFAQLMLPQDIKQVEAVKPITPVQKSFPSPSTTPENSPDPAPQVYTGLIVDAREIKAKPAISLKIFDETGQEVYGSAYVSREFAVQEGMSGYIQDLSAAQAESRVGPNPLTVKGLRKQGSGNSDLVISNADTSRLRSASEHLSFLKKCRVIIVLD